MTKIFTKEMKEFLIENVKGITSQELTDRINEKFNTAFTKEQVRNWKSREKQPSGIEGCGRFKAGHTPHNKGKKAPEWVKEKIKKTKTMFEKGNVPHQTLPLGTERYDKDGYIEVKVTASLYESAGNRGRCSTFDTKWIGKHKKIWIDFYGDKIPEKHKIIFLDKNKYNFSIENLACVSNREHAVMCKKRRYTENAELTQVGKTLTELEFKLREIKR